MQLLTTLEHDAIELHYDVSFLHDPVSPAFAGNADFPSKVADNYETQNQQNPTYKTSNIKM